MLTSETLNEIISNLSDMATDFPVKGLSLSGKAIPYIGWYWRTVDFNRRITLGDCGQFIGFMENNKWGYPEWETTEEQSHTIRKMLEELVDVPTTEKFQAFFDYVQTCGEFV